MRPGREQAFRNDSTRRIRPAGEMRPGRVRPAGETRPGGVSPARPERQGGVRPSGSGRSQETVDRSTSERTSSRYTSKFGKPE